MGKRSKDQGTAKKDAGQKKKGILDKAKEKLSRKKGSDKENKIETVNLTQPLHVTTIEHVDLKQTLTVEQGEESAFTKPGKIKGDKRGSKKDARVKIGEERQPLTLLEELKRNKDKKLKDANARVLKEPPKKKVEEAVMDGQAAIADELKKVKFQQKLKKTESPEQRAFKNKLKYFLHNDVSAIDPRDVPVNHFIANYVPENYVTTLEGLKEAFQNDPRVDFNREEIEKFIYQKIHNANTEMSQYFRALSEGQPLPTQILTNINPKDVPDLTLKFVGNKNKSDLAKYACDAHVSRLVEASNAYFSVLRNFQKEIAKGLEQNLITPEEAQQFAVQFLERNRDHVETFLNEYERYAAKESVQALSEDDDFYAEADLDDLIDELSDDSKEQKRQSVVSDDSEKIAVMQQLDTILKEVPSDGEDSNSLAFYRLRGAFSNVYSDEFNSEAVEKSIKDSIQKANAQMQEYIKALQQGQNPQKPDTPSITAASLPEIEVDESDFENRPEKIREMQIKSLRERCLQEVESGPLSNANNFLQQMAVFQDTLARGIQDKKLSAEEANEYLSKFSSQLNGSLGIEIEHVDDLLDDLDAYVAADDPHPISTQLRKEFEQRLSTLSEEQRSVLDKPISDISPDDPLGMEALRKRLAEIENDPLLSDDALDAYEEEHDDEFKLRDDALLGEDQNVAMPEELKENLFNYLKPALRTVQTLNSISERNPVQMLSQVGDGENAIEEYLTAHKDEVAKYQRIAQDLDFLQRALKLYQDSNPDDGYITEALDIINQINPPEGWALEDPLEFFAQVFKQRDQLNAGEDFRTLEERLIDIAEYYKPDARKAAKQSDKSFDEIEVSPEAWEKAKQYFRENPNSVKCDKYENELSHSFLNIEGHVFAVHTGPCLGTGAYGKVKLIKDEENNLFAVKVQGDGETHDKEAEHNIMRIVGELIGKTQREYGRTFHISDGVERYTDQKFYTAKQFIPGSELYKELNPDLFTDHKAFFKEPISEAVRLEIAIKAMQSIQAAHDKGVVHSDIKPENFIMNVVGEMISVTRTDYGLSKVLPKDADFIQGTKIDGTPGYIAPEIATENRVMIKGEEIIRYKEPMEFKYSFASDVYALGIMLRDDLKLDLGQDFYDAILNKDPAQRPTIAQAVQQLEVRLAAAKENAIQAEELSVEVEGLSPLDKSISDIFVELVLNDPDESIDLSNEIEKLRSGKATLEDFELLLGYSQRIDTDILDKFHEVAKQLVEQGVLTEQQILDKCNDILEKFGITLPSSQIQGAEQQQRASFTSDELDLIERLRNPVSTEEKDQHIANLVGVLFNEQHVARENFMNIMDEIFNRNNWEYIGAEALSLDPTKDDDLKIIVGEFLTELPQSQIQEIYDRLSKIDLYALPEDPVLWQDHDDMETLFEVQRNSLQLQQERRAEVKTTPSSDLDLEDDRPSSKQKTKTRPKSESDLPPVIGEQRRNPQLRFSTNSTPPKIPNAEVIFTVHARPKAQLTQEADPQTDPALAIGIRTKKAPVTSSNTATTSVVSGAEEPPIQRVFSKDAPASDFPPAFVEKIYELHPKQDWVIKQPDRKSIDIISKAEPTQRCHIEKQGEDLKFEANGKGVGDMLNCVKAYQDTVEKDFDLTYDLAVRTEDKAVEVLQKLMEKGISKEQISSIQVGGKQLEAEELDKLLSKAAAEKTNRKSM